MIFRVFLTLALVSIFSPTFANAEKFPSCMASSSDIDGDGYGWENNNTCIIDTNPIGPASFTNLETGQRVNLIRAYWNEFDFLKDVVCSVYSFVNTEYKRIDASITGYQFSLTSLARSSVGEVSVLHSFNSREVLYPWAVNNGRYIGPGDLERSQWVEIVTNVWVQHAVRIWFLDQT